MTDPKLEQEARELLATACGERVEDMLYDRPGFVAKDQAIRAIVAALSQQRDVPEGWVLVPEKMSKQMREVFHDQIRILCRPDERSATVTNDLALWAAMLAAAPSPEQEK